MCGISNDFFCFYFQIMLKDKIILYWNLFCKSPNFFLKMRSIYFQQEVSVFIVHFTFVVILKIINQLQKY